jgi:hypothetical protein
MARRKKGYSGCGCPSGSRVIETGGYGRGWVCQSQKPRRFKGRLIKKPFVKAICPR